MKTKIQKTFAMVALAMVLWLPVAAQQITDKNPPAPSTTPATKPLGKFQQYEPVKPKPQFQIKSPLKCELYYPTPARLDLRNPQVVPASFSRFSPTLAPARDSIGTVTVIVTNTSGGKLKAGEMVYYKTDSQPTQAHKLTADWAAGKLLSFYYQPGNQTCKAWYLK